MYPTSFKETNHVLGAGDNPNTDQLPVAYCTKEDTPGVIAIVSKWKLSLEELKEVNETGVVWIAVMAPVKKPTQPPVWVLGNNPFEGPNAFEPLPL